MTSASSLHEAGNQSQYSGTTQRDGRTHVHPWLIHVTIWQNPQHYCKVISLQFKKLINSKYKETAGFSATMI